MHPYVFYVAVAWLAALLCVVAYLVVRARTTAVRILAADTLTLLLIVLLVLMSHYDRTSFYLDAALALALLSFIATLATARYWSLRRPF